MFTSPRARNAERPLNWATEVKDGYGEKSSEKRDDKKRRPDSDQVIREKPASRGTETSAEVLVGRSARADGVERRSTAAVLAKRLLWAAASRDPPARQSRRTRSHPPPQSVSEGIGGARGLGNLVRPESHPEPRGFFPGAVGRSGGQAGDQILRSPRSTPPSCPCRSGSIGLFAPFHRPSVPM